MLKIDRTAFLALALGMNLAGCASSKPATGPASNTTTTDKSMAPTQEGGMAVGILLAAGGGALGVQLGGLLPTLSGDPDVRPDLGLGDPVEADVLPSAVGLVWRALILWLLIILLVTVANLVP